MDENQPEQTPCDYGCAKDNQLQECARCGHAKDRHSEQHPHPCHGKSFTSDCSCAGFTLDPHAKPEQPAEEEVVQQSGLLVSDALDTDVPLQNPQQSKRRKG